MKGNPNKTAAARSMRATLILLLPLGFVLSPYSWTRTLSTTTWVNYGSISLKEEAKRGLSITANHDMDSSSSSSCDMTLTSAPAAEAMTDILARLGCHLSQLEPDDKRNHNDNRNQHLSDLAVSTSLLAQEQLPRPTCGLGEYSYSRFATQFPLYSNQGALHFVILYDRPTANDSDPLLGFVNSILLHSTAPVALHIATRHAALPWLSDLLDTTPAFQVFLYNHEKLSLLGNAIRFMRNTKFRSMHPSVPYTLVKPFLATLPFPGYHGDDSLLQHDVKHNKNQTIPHHHRQKQVVERYMAIDDDIVFWDDPVQLFQELDPHRLAMSCPIDTYRVKKYFQKPGHQRNGDGKRYCNSGLIHVPLPPRRFDPDYQYSLPIVDQFIQTAYDMENDYPKTRYVVSDQEIYNRMFRNNKKDMGIIPCEWHCEFGSLRGADNHIAGVVQNDGTNYSAPGAFRFTNCPAVEDGSAHAKTCRLFHFNRKAYKLDTPLIFPQTSNGNNAYQNYSYFAEELDSQHLLYNHFLPRVLASMGSSHNVTSLSALLLKSGETSISCPGGKLDAVN